jgi:hypothetical protein
MSSICVIKTLDFFSFWHQVRIGITNKIVGLLAVRFELDSVRRAGRRLPGAGGTTGWAMSADDEFYEGLPAPNGGML